MKVIKVAKENKKTVFGILIALLLIAILLIPVSYKYGKESAEVLNTEVESDPQEEKGYTAEDLQRITIYSNNWIMSRYIQDQEELPVTTISDIEVDESIWDAFSSTYSVEFVPYQICFDGAEGDTVGGGDISQQDDDGVQVVEVCDESNTEAIHIITSRGKVDILPILRTSLSSTNNLRNVTKVENSLVFSTDAGVFTINPSLEEVTQFVLENQEVSYKDFLLENQYVYIIHSNDILGINMTDQSYKAYNVAHQHFTDTIIYDKFGEAEIENGVITVTPVIEEFYGNGDAYTGLSACKTNPLWYLRKILIDTDTGEVSYVKIIEEDCTE